jgi:hypothetical protein
MPEGIIAFVIVKRRKFLVQKVTAGVEIPRSEPFQIEEAGLPEQASLLFKSFFQGQTECKGAYYITSVDSRSEKTRIHYFEVKRWTGPLLSKEAKFIWFPLAGWKRLPNEDDRKALKEMTENLDLDNKKI